MRALAGIAPFITKYFRMIISPKTWHFFHIGLSKGRWRIQVSSLAILLQKTDVSGQWLTFLFLSKKNGIFQAIENPSGPKFGAPLFWRSISPFKLYRPLNHAFKPDKSCSVAISISCASDCHTSSQQPWSAMLSVLPCKNPKDSTPIIVYLLREIPTTEPSSARASPRIFAHGGASSEATLGAKNSGSSRIG